MITGKNPVRMIGHTWSLNDLHYCGGSLLGRGHEEVEVTSCRRRIPMLRDEAYLVCRAAGDVMPRGLLFIVVHSRNNLYLVLYSIKVDSFSKLDPLLHP
jgi:hypothetical protein